MRYPSFWQRRGPLAWLLWPLSRLVCLEAARRRRRARPEPLACPLIVVGNITVGGTGKTPIVIALVDALRRAGWQPGVVSRGVGVKVGIEPLDLAEAPSAAVCGDEPWLIRQRTGAAVVVHPRRRQAAEQLLARYPEVDVIVSDDGLQHHRLARDIEWVVVDGRRGLGNGLCLPAGPLREPVATLAEADAILVNGGPVEALPAEAGVAPRAYRSDFRLTGVFDLFDGREHPAEYLAGREVLALAGIGNPERFFAMLEADGARLEGIPLDDHAAPTSAHAEELLGDGRPVIITEKDAVKWPVAPSRSEQVLVARGGIELPPALIESTLARLATLSAPFPS